MLCGLPASIKLSQNSIPVSAVTGKDFNARVLFANVFERVFLVTRSNIFGIILELLTARKLLKDYVSRIVKFFFIFFYFFIFFSYNDATLGGGITPASKFPI